MCSTATGDNSFDTEKNVFTMQGKIKTLTEIQLNNVNLDMQVDADRKVSEILKNFLRYLLNKLNFSNIIQF